MVTARQIDRDPSVVGRSPLASRSLLEHVLRGIAGLAAAVLGVALVAAVGPVSLVLLVVTAVAWRGCPTCWTVGLIGTMADARARRDCARCRAVASSPPSSG